MTRPGIAAQVFAAAAPPASRRHHAIVVAVLLHLGVAVMILRAQPTLETWSATMAARVHDELTRLQLADVERTEPTPPPPEPPPSEPPPAASEPAPAVASAPPAPSRPARPAPARAGKVVAAPPGALDLTGDVVVVGNASAYVGGATSSTGTGTKPVPNASSEPSPAPPPAPTASPPPASPGAVDRSRPVALASDEWNCPWPLEADGLALDEQVATIRVTVDARGVVESAELVTDPGDGFGAAALACARRTRFTPALDRDGRPVRAPSPAIRVHFTRDR
ncbi:TonB family protein [Nannocystis pusilla]|uniref:TonB family protein n=1 Tax=Nannocystis pusilla TaxID=889268 RepID=A0A9X3IWR4_9BACT|nr:TonB family protein [Nannocystis pusilla]